VTLLVNKLFERVCLNFLGGWRARNCGVQCTGLRGGRSGGHDALFNSESLQKNLLVG
jgi:hypothetical protein